MATFTGALPCGVATYTALDALDLPALARRYGLHEPTAEALAGGATNSSFRLTVPGEDRGYVLTALDDHDEAGARRLARIIRTAARLGLPTDRVVAGLDGDDVTMLGDRPYLLKELIPGRVRDPLPAELLPAAGELLARLHTLPPEELNLPVAARRLSAAHLAVAAGFADREFTAWMESRLAVVGRHEADRRWTPCAIHGDLFADNLIVRPDGGLSVIDWETASLDDPLLDLGMTAVGLCQDTAGRLSAERLGRLLDGYCRLRPLPPQDRADLPVQIVHASVIIAFHRYHRHNVRFPDAERATHYRRMIGFAESVLPGTVGRQGRVSS